MKLPPTGYRVVSIVLMVAVVCIALIVILGNLPDTWMMPLVIAAGALLVAAILIFLNGPRRPSEPGKTGGSSDPAS